MTWKADNDTSLSFLNCDILTIFVPESYPAYPLAIELLSLSVRKSDSIRHAFKLTHKKLRPHQGT